VHDIAAIQAIYGADMTTRTGDTTYGFNSNAGRDSYDFTKTPAPVMAIWDAGGIDTLDASGYATDQIIDLTPGSLSSIGGVTYDTAPSFEQVNANRAAAGYAPVALATYNSNMARWRPIPWSAA
jgi:serralysin